MKELPRADVVVVGGGAAGALAAVAARRAGAAVMVVRRGEGATAMSSGAVDVAEAPGSRVPGPLRGATQPGLPWMEAASLLAQVSRFHPFARVRGALEELPRALQLLAEVAADAALTGSAHPGHNLVLPTALGPPKRAALAQASMVTGDLAVPRGRTMLVHWPDVLCGDAHHVARVLEAVARMGPSGAALGELVVAPVEGVLAPLDGLRPAREIARTLEQVEGRRAVTDGLVHALRGAPGVDRVLFPPVLGLSRAEELRRHLSEAAGVPVGEWLSGPPSVPGERLQRALDVGMARAGAAVVDGRALGARTARGEVVELDVETQPGERHVVATPALVLCTGRFLAGGLVRDQQFREPLLDLPVFLDGRPAQQDWVGEHVAERPDEAQPFMRAGLLVDGLLRPLSREGGTPVYANVRAAGSILAGYDTARGEGGIGVAALTGMLAGRWAAAATNE